MYASQILVLSRPDIDGLCSQREDLFVQFLGWYENSECLLIVMEYIQDGDLGQYLKQSGCYSSYNTSEFTWQLHKELETLHQMNICHRDLKPPVCSLCSAAQITTRAYNLTDHPHCLSSTHLGQDCRLWGLETHGRNRARQPTGHPGRRCATVFGFAPEAHSHRNSVQKCS